MYETLTALANGKVIRTGPLLQFSSDKVELEVQPEALTAIAEKAIGQNTGARGLRSIMEYILMDCMYHLPTYTNVGKVTVVKECVTDGAKPLLFDRQGSPVVQW